ncbi:hypothetical protein [Ruminococcus sp. NK3A76]|uniref:hypothetical protein n=1 Tax=Ruminococcus sp. NK3A76 TaxID=877411 RepID=UPI00048AAB70|nr:hypothetical protein [Ruminococcus sp. NK3A76]
MSIRKRAAALVTAAAITASMAGCSDTSYIAKADGENINAGIYIDYMLSSMQSQIYMWQYTGVTEDFFDQKVGDKDFATYLLDTAMEKTKRYAAVEKLFKDSEMKISADDMKSINNDISDTWESVSKLYESEGISKDSLKKVAVNSKKEEMLFDYYFGKEGKEKVSKDELVKYMNDSYVRFKAITIYKSTNEDETQKEAENKEKQELYEKYSEKAKDVKFADFDALIDEYNTETTPAEEDDTTADDTAADDTTADTNDDSSNADESSKGDDSSKADDASSDADSSKADESSEKEVTESVSSFEDKAEDSSVADDSSVTDSKSDDSSAADESKADESKADTDSKADESNTDDSAADDTETTGESLSDPDETEADIPDPYTNERLINFAEIDEDTLKEDYGKRMQAVRDAKTDDIVTYEDDSAYYIMSIGDVTERSSEYLDDETNFDTVLHEAKDKDFEAKITAAQDAMKFEENKDAVDRYLPKTVYEKYNDYLNKNSNSKAS